jgi:hypothetical protein
LGVVTCLDLRDGTELGVRAEDEVDVRPGPSDVARSTIPPFIDVLGP